MFVQLLSTNDFFFPIVYFSKEGDYRSVLICNFSLSFSESSIFLTFYITGKIIEKINHYVKIILAKHDDTAGKLPVRNAIEQTLPPVTIFPPM